MSNMKHKSYLGSIEVDIEGNFLHGKLLHIKDLVTYEASSPTELKAEFESAVDDYLYDCEQLGQVPDVPYKGQFNIRVAPALHRELAINARVQGKTLNEYVTLILRCHEHVGANGQVNQNNGHHVILLGHRVFDTQRFSTQNSVAYRRTDLQPNVSNEYGEKKPALVSGWVQNGQH